MRTASRLRRGRGVAGVPVLLALLLLLVGCGAGADPRPAGPVTAGGANPASPAGAPSSTSSTRAGAATAATGSASSSAAGSALPRYATPGELSAAVLTAVRSRGSVLITTTAQGTPLVSRRSVQLVGAGQNSASQVTIPGRPDQTLVVAGGVPYLSVDADAEGRHWQRTRFEDLASNKVWASAVYAVDLPTELASWRLGAVLTGGDVDTVAGEGVRTYTLTLGPAAASAQVRLDRVAAADRPAVTERLGQMHYDLTVTMGADDLPRTVTTVAPASGLVTTQTYSTWGGVTVAAPSPDDVAAPPS